MSKNQESVELINPDTGDSVEVTVDFNVDVEPTEYEGAYVFYQGGASMSDCTALPYTFKGKEYRGDIPPELFPFIWFNERFYKSNKDGIKSTFLVLTDSGIAEEDKCDAMSDAKGYINDYMTWLFDEYVAPEVDVPSNHYPDGRYD